VASVAAATDVQIRIRRVTAPIVGERHLGAADWTR
jgi:hypothetical protein